MREKEDEANEDKRGNDNKMRSIDILDNATDGMLHNVQGIGC